MLLQLCLAALLFSSGTMKADSVERVRFIDGPYGKLSVRMATPPDFDPVGKKYPVILVMHGVMATKQTPPLPHLAGQLAKEGYVCLRFDFNAQGGSDGDLLKNTVPSEIEDARAVFQYARSLPFAKNVSLLGHSQGGLVATLLAGDLQQKGTPPQALALLAPGVSVRRYAREGKFFGAKCDPSNPPEYVRVWWYRFGRDYIQSAQTLPIEEAASQYTGPVCVIQGGKDNIVPPEDVEAFLPNLPQAQFTRIDNAGHLFLWHQAQVLTLLKVFFAENL